MKTREWDKGFSAGIVSALAVLRAWREDGAMYDEIVQSAGEAEVLAEAKRSGAMRWSGLDAYKRRQKRRGKP